MKKLIIVLALLTWGCSSTRMIKSKHGPVYKKQLREMRQQFKL